MRVIDSALYLARKYKKKLVVIWVLDKDLNCSFYELFQKIDKCKLIFLDKNNNILHYLVFSMLLFLEKLKQYSVFNIVKFFFSIDILFSNRDLSKIYSSLKYETNNTIRGIDKLFINVISKKICAIKAKGNYYLSSCHRLIETNARYVDFVPVKELEEVINSICNSFNNYTIGVHIRGGDHKISSNVSTIDKFEKEILKMIQKDNNYNFFLCTDSIEMERYLKEKFPDQVFCFQKSSLDRALSQSIKEALIDLYCLSKTNMILGSHFSSFTQTASDLGQIKEVIVK